jgi:hypothetical protein
MAPRHTFLLLATFVASSPFAAHAQSTQRAVIEKRTEATRSAEEQRTFSEKIGWELATTDDGVRIEHITKNSVAAEAHLEEKDVIKKIAGENVSTADRVAAILTDLRDKGETKTEVVVLREGEEISYLLSLEDLNLPNARTTRTTVQESQDLVSMIQQLQLQVQQQQQMLQMVLTEVQTLRTQLGGVPATRVNPAVPTGTQFTGDIVAPLGTVGAPITPTGVPANNKQQTQPPANQNPRR